MGLLPASIEFPAPGLRFSVVPQEEADLAGVPDVEAQAGDRRVFLAQTGQELRVYGARRGSALHILVLQAFARRLAADILDGYLELVARECGISRFALRIGDQRRRWGSCSLRNAALPKICLNWRALLLAPELLRQLCLHELCHIREMNHSRAFHALLLAHNPQYRQHERGLGVAWKNLPPWTVHRSRICDRSARTKLLRPRSKTQIEAPDFYKRNVG